MPGGEGSITVCLGELRAGNEDTVRALLDRYRGPLEEYARQNLRRLGASAPSPTSRTWRRRRSWR